MVNQVPPAYPIPTEVAIATYSYTDIAEGTGVQIFYGANSRIETTRDYHLFGSVIASNDITTVVASGNVDLDFDLSPFNLPKSVKGTAYASVPIYVNCTGGSGGSSLNAYFTVKIIHVDADNNETQMGSTVQSETLSIGPINIARRQMLVPITLPQTHFKKGEILRCSIQLFRGVVTDATGTVGIGHDPKGRANVFTAGTSTLEVHIPFILDI